MSRTTPAKNSAAITFNAVPFKIGAATIVLLPREASAKLPSRGMVLVEGVIDERPFKLPLEPDGRGSHWFKADEAMRKAGVKPGGVAAVRLAPSKDWPEPDLPADLRSALSRDKQAADLWDDITPMARWDWLRWISSTGNSETRQRRIVVAFSKLKNGTRRPCCFNRALCTDMSVSKSGALLEPSS